MKKVFLLVIAFFLMRPVDMWAKNGKVVVAYVRSGTDEMPDPGKMTHICYAFADIADSFDKVNIQNPDRLHAIAGLKKQNPELKILLSIGGWGSGNFSEMCGSDSLRTAFADHCANLVKDFGIDGIDLDWEYPTQSSAGISSSPSDRVNFTKLIHDLRQALGPDGILTLATVAGGNFYDFDDFIDDVDFVNVMSYDMNRVPLHHSPLYNSKRFGDLSCEKAINAHLEKGVPLEKLVLGMPFYGHGNKDELPYYIRYWDLDNYPQMKKKWDRKAKVPYLVTPEGKIVACFDNEKSLKIKCKWAKKRGLRGVMYWSYSHDDTQGTFRTLVYDLMMK